MLRCHVDVSNGARTSLTGTYLIPFLFQRKLPFSKLEIATRQQTRKLLQLATADRFGPRRRSVLDIARKLRREVA